MFDFITKSLSGLFGSKSERDLKEIRPIVEQIHTAYAKIKDLSNDQLRDKTKEFRQRIQDHIVSEVSQINELRAKSESDSISVEEKEKIYTTIDTLKKNVNALVQESLNDILPEAFAVIKETAKRFKENAEVEVTASDFDKDYAAKKKHVRIEGDKAYWANTWEAAGNMVTWDMVHYDVQLIGGIVLHQGKISEMATGEGKTLVATLPVYLNALSGKGLHIVTVNNYLSRRDSEWMGPLFEFHGLRVDCIDKHEPNSEERRQAYLADITYGTNNEFGFDYLRDNMTKSPDELVQREHFYAIVDEVDSVLIDDARTPLIISGPTPKGDTHEFQEFKPKVEKLVNAQKAYINTVLADAKRLIGEGNEKDGGFALLRAYRGLPKNKALIKFLSEPGVKGILLKTENYYMQDHNKEMPKIDEALYFVIDEKNQTVELTERGLDLITSATDDPKFFVMPDVGSEIAEIEKSSMSGPEKAEKKDALMTDFAIKSERIHTVNQLLRAYSLFEKDVEYVVMDNKVKIVDEQTGRILDGRRYSDGLHQAIESKENVRVEASTQTWATVTLQNYFRMYAKLAGMTGTAETEAGEFWDIYKLDVVVIPTNRPISRTDHEDRVYNTKREKYNAVIEDVIRQTEAGRPVLVGTTSVEISELLSRMLKMKGIRHNVLNAKLHQKEAEIVAQAGQKSTVTIATNMAGRGTDIKLGPGVKEVGGLAIIGTERHDSRRVDRQLRGRAGRQGDPGSSQFFVSLEDDLMRLFGSERIQKLMGKMGFEEGEVIQHPMITRSIERAQKKVEENNFATRKRLLEYDDVMNSQREVVYSKRRHALFGERLSVDISNMIYDVCESLINEYHEAKDYDGFQLDLIRNLAIDAPFNEDEFRRASSTELVEKLFDHAAEAYRRKTEYIVSAVQPVVKNVYESSAHMYENIVVPFSDGMSTLQVVCNLKNAYENGKEVLSAFEKNISLAIIDDAWKEHLREMDDLKQAVHNAVYEQKDPLLVYKFESFNLFKKMIERVNKEIVSFLFRAKLPTSENQVKETKAPAVQKETHKLQTSRSEVSQPQRAQAAVTSGGGEEERPKPQPMRAEKTVGRNDPCPCGSGKKFKHCHGK